MASLTVTVTTLGVAITAPFAGRFSDRQGRKRTVVRAALATAVVTVLASQSASLNVFLFWRFLQGVFTPGIFAVTVAYIHDEFPRQKAGRAMAAYVAGTVVGGFCGRFLTGILATHYGWQTAFLVLGILGSFCALALARTMPPDSKPHVSASTVGFGGAVLRHLRNRRLTATYAVGFCVLFSLTSTFTYINFYLSRSPFHLRPASLGSLFFVYLIGAVITPIAGRYVDRYGHRTVLASAISCGIVGILATLIPRLSMVVLGLTLCCTAVFIAQTCSSSFLGVATKENRALAVGLYVTFYYLGGSAGAALPGFLWRMGGWPASVALIATVQALTVVLALLLWSAAPGDRSVAYDDPSISGSSAA